jgi:hypothetical protein
MSIAGRRVIWGMQAVFVSMEGRSSYKECRAAEYM